MIDTNRIVSPDFDLGSFSTAERGRIAMVSTHGYVAAEPPLGNPDTGGQVVYVLELSRKLAELGFEVDIWTRQFEDQPEEEPVAENVRILRVPCGGKNFIAKEFLHKSLGEWTLRASNKIEKEGLKYDFINSHYWDAGIAGQALADSLKVPHIHTPHSLGIWKKRKMSEDFPEDVDTFDATYNFSERIRRETILYKECDSLVATTPIQLDMFSQDYGIEADKLHMIPPGYDDNRFFPVSEPSRDVIRESMGFTGKKMVTSIGRLSRNKGFDLLVDAFAVLAKRVPDAYLFMALGSETEANVEDPMLEEIVEKVTELGLESRVTITNSLPDEAMADFYRASDVFCLPSRYEPFGMTAIEAMACGTPTVVTTNGGLYRTIEYGKDALFADSFDAEDFGLTISKILKHPSIKKRVGRNGAHTTRGLFTWTGIAQQLLNIADTQKKATVRVSEAMHA